MSQVSITVFTPTYNRGYMLTTLYNSLIEQNYTQFEWLIYDDGSTDNTFEIVESFMNQSQINIKYVKTDNYGKYIALNKGVDLANGELFFIVDSDDTLPSNSLQIINEIWSTIPLCKRNEFIGIGGRKYLHNKKNNLFNFSEKFCDKDLITFNLIDGNTQDKAEVFITEKLKKYKFPEVENNKFMTESVLWYQIAEDGWKIRWFNDIIYEALYLEDGLSHNYYQQRINSLESTCLSYNLLSSYSLPTKYKLRYKINYFRYGFVKKNFFQLASDLRNKKFFLISSIIGYIYYLYDKVKYQNKL